MIIINHELAEHVTTLYCTHVNGPSLENKMYVKIEKQSLNRIENAFEKR